MCLELFQLFFLINVKTQNEEESKMLYLIDILPVQLLQT